MKRFSSHYGYLQTAVYYTNETKTAIKKKGKVKKPAYLLLLFFICVTAMSLACAANDTTSTPTIYVAWSDDQDSYFFTSPLQAIEAAGAQPVVLDQVLSADLAYDPDKVLRKNN